MSIVELEEKINMQIDIGLSVEDILECAEIGDRLGYKTYVTPRWRR